MGIFSKMPVQKKEAMVRKGNVDLADSNTSLANRQ